MFSLNYCLHLGKVVHHDFTKTSGSFTWRRICSMKHVFHCSLPSTWINILYFHILEISFYFILQVLRLVPFMKNPNCCFHPFFNYETQNSFNFKIVIKRHTLRDSLTFRCVNLFYKRLVYKRLVYRLTFGHRC